MAKKYDNNFKTMLVKLFTKGQSASSLGDQYGVNSALIRKWKREYYANDGAFSKKKELSPEELEIKQLKKDIKKLGLELDILKKAEGFFAKSDN